MSVMLYPCMFCVDLSINMFVVYVCCVSYSVCELFGETLRHIFGCGCYFVGECYGVVVV